MSSENPAAMVPAQALTTRETLLAKVRQEARQEIERRRVRRESQAASRLSLLDFIKYTKADYVADQFHIEVCKIMDAFHAEIMAGHSPRYIIVAPPQHGKTEIVSRRYPAWALGKDPHLCFLGCSYNQRWAEDICRNIQQIMDSEDYHQVFDVRIPEKRFALRDAKRVSDYFELEPLFKCRHCRWCQPAWHDKPVRCPECQGQVYKTRSPGRYKAVGREGGATGRPAHVVIIDDPFKDAAEAMSETIRESSWQWYTQAIRTRVQKGGGILIMATRWHEDDTIGRALEQMKAARGSYRDEWKTWVFPALAIETEDKFQDYVNLARPLEWRKPDEALSPVRYGFADLKTLQSSLSPAAWNALYQGSPVPLTGNIFEVDRWQYYNVLPDLREFDLIIQSWDCTFKETTSADYVAGQVWGVSWARRWLLDRVCEQMSFPRLKQAIREMKARWPMCSHILVEDKANGSAVIDELKREISGFVAIDPAGGKIARAWAASGDQSAGNCFLPEPGCTIVRPKTDKYDELTINHTWVMDFIGTCKKFPVVPHDDEVDAFTQAINWIRNNSHGLLQVWRMQAEAMKKKPGAPAQTAQQITQELARAQLEQVKDQPGAMTMDKLTKSPLQKPTVTAQTPLCPKCNIPCAQYGDVKVCNVCGWKSTQV